MIVSPVANEVAIVAVDPGRKTGVARGLFPVAGAGSIVEAFSAGSRVETWECEGTIDEQATEIVEEAVSWFTEVQMAGVSVTALRFVMEDFNLRTQHADLTPVELAQAIKSGWTRSIWRDIAIVRQPPSSAMTYATNERLRRWGAWQKGSEHRRDATRHLLLRLSAELS